MGGSFLEDAILRIDYVGLKVAFQLSKPFSETIARHALTEMADVVAHFANAVGESESLKEVFEIELFLQVMPLHDAPAVAQFFE